MLSEDRVTIKSIYSSFVILHLLERERNLKIEIDGLIKMYCSIKIKKKINCILVTMYGTEYDNDIEHLGTSLEFPLVPDLRSCICY